MLTIYVTNTCNLNCKYCFVDKSNRKYRLKWSEDLKKIIIQFIETPGNKKKISIMGGEPLLCIDFLSSLFLYIDEIKKIYKDKDISYAPIPTNGTIYNKDFFALLKKNNIELRFSIDNYLNTTDPNRRDIKDSNLNYKKIGENLLLYKEIFGVFPGVRIVVTNNNIKIFYDLIKYFIEKIGLKDIHFGISHGFDLTNNIYAAYIKEFNKIFKLYIKYINSDSNKQISIDPIEFIIVDSLRGGIKDASIFNNRNQVCGMGNEISISFDGNIYSCDFIAGADYINADLKKDYLIGNIKTGVDLLKAKKDIKNNVLPSFSDFGKNIGLNKKICYLFDTKNMKLNNKKNYLILYKINYYIYEYIIKNLGKINKNGLRYIRNKYGLYKNNAGIFKNN